VSDLIYILSSIAFFALSGIYAYFCGKIR